jgi:hypothetical protein
MSLASTIKTITRHLKINKYVSIIIIDSLRTAVETNPEK